MKAKAVILAGLLVGLALGLVVSYSPPADGARNASGTYSLPLSPVVSGTTITSTWANTTLADMKTEFTNSLDRGGRGCMTAPLQVTNGTVAAPSLTFCTDTDTGLYRIGANNPGMSAGGVKSQEWTSTGPVTTIGYTATQSVANTQAITATGNGTAGGVLGTGGATSGPGLSGVGGAPNGSGVSGTGTGSGAGVAGTGGATNGNGVAGTGTGSGSGVAGTGGATNGSGVSGTGTGSGAGVAGTGGTSNGAGVQGTGGATNGNGVQGTGTGTGSGVYGLGGSSNGGGLYGQGTGTGSGCYAQGGATNGTGFIGQGVGTGYGGSFTGGTSGKGVVATGQGGLVGIHATSSSTSVDVGKFDGYVSLSGATNPTSTTAFTNQLTPTSLVKAHGRLTTGVAPAVTINSGFNITSASCAANIVTVTMASAMSSSTSYTVIVGGQGTVFMGFTITGATTFTVSAADSAGAALNMCASPFTFTFLALGAQ